jgi:alpha-mannosidase II
MEKLKRKTTCPVKMRVKSLIEKEFYKIETGSEFLASFKIESGFLEKLSTYNETVDITIQFVQYENAAEKISKSNAYIFMPNGPAVEYSKGQNDWIRIEKGPLRSRVCVSMQKIMHCIHIFPTVNKHKSLKFPLIHVWNLVDLRSSLNFELAMRVQTDIKNNDILHSDLNGFQYTKRKRHDILQLQGNVYPMASGAFIQDSRKRFSVLTAQSLGVASLANSQIEVFLDRHVDQDINFDLPETANDNPVVPSQFIFLFETVKGNIESSARADFPSLTFSRLSNELLYPIVKLVVTHGNHEMTKEIRFSSKEYPCDLHLVNMRTMQTRGEEPRKNEIGLILHRMAYDDCSDAFIDLPRKNLDCQLLDNKNFLFADFFSFKRAQNNFSIFVESTFLNFAKKSIRTSVTGFVNDNIKPFNLEAFQIQKINK